MKNTIYGKFLFGMAITAVGLSLAACNTTKATIDTTINFFSSTSPESLFTADGVVAKKQKINLFAGVAYENLRQEAAAGGGQYVTSLATLYQVPTEKHPEFAQLLQNKHGELFMSSLLEDRTAHLKMVEVLNRELTAQASLQP
jgi:hypothetical protein